METKEKLKALDNKQLEWAKIIGEPRDPRKPVSTLISSVCDIETAEPEDYVYYFDALLETDKVYIITSTGAVTQENVTPDTPVAMTFFDVASPEYYIKFTDLASKKENVIARKVATINRAMNAYENYKIVYLIDEAAPSGNDVTLDSGSNTYTYKNLIDQIDTIMDYSDNYTLIAGTTIAKDIKLWDWTDSLNCVCIYK